MELGRDVIFNPLVDGLWRGVCLYLLQQLLFQLQQREQEAQALPLQDLQHAVLVLIDFCQVVSYKKGVMGMFVSDVTPKRTLKSRLPRGASASGVTGTKF